jgi:hypothetical protein
VWATASRPSTRIFDARHDVTRELGQWVQVSRLGNPLINEVIIPVGSKDYWNAQDPSKDQQFQKYYEKPELAGIVNLLYGSAIVSLGGQPARTEGRADLSLILLTGVKLPDGTPFTYTGKTPADLLRLNVAVKPNANGACMASNPSPDDLPDPLGVLNGDLCGFPNGRRLADDATDIELRAVADGYGSFLNGVFGLPNNAPNNAVGDGVNENDMSFLSAFPYVGTPHQGYEHTHHKVGSTSTPAIK